MFRVALSAGSSSGPVRGVRVSAPSAAASGATPRDPRLQPPLSARGQKTAERNYSAGRSVWDREAERLLAISKEPSLPSCCPVLPPGLEMDGGHTVLPGARAAVCPPAPTVPSSCSRTCVGQHCVTAGHGPAAPRLVPVRRTQKKATPNRGCATAPSPRLLGSAPSPASSTAPPQCPSLPCARPPISVPIPSMPSSPHLSAHPFHALTSPSECPRPDAHGAP